MKNSAPDRTVCALLSLQTQPGKSFSGFGTSIALPAKS
jgi:hypothetical protein